MLKESDHQLAATGPQFAAPLDGATLRETAYFWPSGYKPGRILSASTLLPKAHIRTLLEQG